MLEKRNCVFKYKIHWEQKHWPDLTNFLSKCLCLVSVLSVLGTKLRFSQAPGPQGSFIPLFQINELGLEEDQGPTAGK